MTVYIILGIVFILIFAVVIMSLKLYDMAIARKKTVKEKDGDNAPSLYKPEDIIAREKWFDAAGFKTVEMTSEDGLKLTGYYLEAPAKRAVILAHGYSGDAKEMSTYAEIYHDRYGFNILMPDARGHGKSEGHYAGFGWHERNDYLKWIKFITDTVGADCEIVLHGVSMGAATVLITSGEDLPDNVKAVIADCSYTSLTDQLKHTMKKLFRLPPFPGLYTASLVSRIRAGYFFSEASPFRQTAKSKTPTLFIHGEADTFVPFEMVNRLYNECSAEKELFVVPDAKHALSIYTDKQGYEERVIRFLSKYMEVFFFDAS